jgi:hypothetical protein
MISIQTSAAQSLRQRHIRIGCSKNAARIPRLFDTTQAARVTFATVFDPVLVSREARPAGHGAKGGLQRRLRGRGWRPVGCVGA